jgi:hypothetical protein
MGSFRRIQDDKQVIPSVTHDNQNSLISFSVRVPLKTQLRFEILTPEKFVGNIVQNSSLKPKAWSRLIPAGVKVQLHLHTRALGFISIVLLFSLTTVHIETLCR